MIIDLSNYYDFLPEAYHPFFSNDEDRFLVLYGGAGSGKSYAAALKIVYRVMTEKNLTCLVVRKTRGSIRESCFSLLKEVVHRLGLSEFFEVNKTEMSFICTLSGSKIITGGLDNVEKLKSIMASSIWIEEASEIDQADFDQLNLRLRGLNAKHQIILTFNPVSRFSWLKKYFFDSPKKAYILHTTYQDNPFLNDEYTSQLEGLKDIDATLYQIYARGEWGVQTGLVYSDNVFFQDGPIPLRTIKKTRYGLDFGFCAPTALVKCMFDDERNVYIEEMLYKPGLTNQDLIREMENLKVSKLDYIHCDNAEPDRIKELKRAGFNARPCKKSRTVEEGINFVKQHHLHVSRENENLVEELQAYVWDQKDGQEIDRVVRENDHLLDALRYVILSEIRIQAPQAVPRALLFRRACA